MIQLDIPFRGHIELRHAVFDINGTLACDGMLIPEVVERVHALLAHLSLHTLTAGTQGNIPTIEQELGFPVHLINRASEKEDYVRGLSPEGVIAFGNGMNDLGMFRAATIGVGIIGPEGMATQILQVADVIALHPLDALDLLLKPKRLVATLRG
jgi:soluble P-type ATPase